MNIQRSFTYQFEDEHWVEKLALGALISIVPILNLAIAGYVVATIRNVAGNARPPLPNWDDLGAKFRDGLILTAAGLVYAAPIIAVVLVPLGLLEASYMWNNQGFQELERFLAASSAILLGIFLVLLVLYGFLLSLLRPAMLVVFSRDGTFASCFRLGEMYHIMRLHTRPFLTTWLGVIIAGMAVGLIVTFINLVVGWIPCLGWLVGAAMALGTAIYLLTVDADLYGQFRLESLGR